MDLVIAHPFLHQKGGVERVVLEIAKEFNPIIYSIVYDPKQTFSEFKEFEIKHISKSNFELPFFFLKGDERRYNAIGAGFRYFDFKIKDDYDVINAHGTPSEWIRNRNERVCWFCHSPNREAFDLYSWRMAKLPIWKRPINWGLIQAYRFAEFRTVPKIEAICTNSEVTNERVRKYLHRKDAEVIHPGIDPKEYECESYDILFLYPSRIVPEKRFGIAIEAFKRFYAKVKAKDKKRWKLVIAGYVHDTE
ncbi:MAG: glycosyltransferase, partial [Candidatus Micrarchaeota archaeon]